MKERSEVMVWGFFAAVLCLVFGGFFGFMLGGYQVNRLWIDRAFEAEDALEFCSLQKRVMQEGLTEAGEDLKLVKAGLLEEQGKTGACFSACFKALDVNSPELCGLAELTCIDYWREKFGADLNQVTWSWKNEEKGFRGLR